MSGMARPTLPANTSYGFAALQVSFDLHTEYRSSRDTENVALAHKKRNDKLRGVAGGAADDDGHETASSLSIEDPTHRSRLDDDGEGGLTDVIQAPFEPRSWRCELCARGSADVPGLSSTRPTPSSPNQHEFSRPRRGWCWPALFAAASTDSARIPACVWQHENEHGAGEQGGRASSSRMRRIEEISIAPGRERAVYVCYCPAATTKDALQAARCARWSPRTHSPFFVRSS